MKRINRIKVFFIGTAIVLAVCTAFATRPCQGCTFAPQYYWNGFTYVYAGEFGADYFCWQSGGTCTYYRPFPIAQPNYFAPCRLGVYTAIP